MKYLTLLLLGVAKIYNAETYSEDKPKIQKNDISFSDQPWANLSYPGEESTILTSSSNLPCDFVSSTGYCDLNDCYNIQLKYPESCSSLILSYSVSSQTFVDEMQKILNTMSQLCKVKSDSLTKIYDNVVLQALYTVSGSQAPDSLPSEICYAFTMTAQKNSGKPAELQCIIDNVSPVINKYADDLQTCKNKSAAIVYPIIFISCAIASLGCLTYKNYPRIKNCCTRTLQSSGLWGSRRRRNSNVIIPDDKEREILIQRGNLSSPSLGAELLPPTQNSNPHSPTLISEDLLPPCSR